MGGGLFESQPGVIARRPGEQNFGNLREGVHLLEFLVNAAQTVAMERLDRLQSSPQVVHGALMTAQSPADIGRPGLEPAKRLQVVAQTCKLGELLRGLVRTGIGKNVIAG